MTPDSAPVASDDEVVVHGIPTESLALLVNDRDPDDDLVDPDQPYRPSIGTVECGTGDCRYVPPVGYNGPYPLQTSFSYTVGDGRGLFDTADVKVTS